MLLSLRILGCMKIKFFSSFYSKLGDIINSSFNLGEPIPYSKVIRKILRFLPERFRPKATVIKESKNIDSMRVDELVGFIQTYEMTLPNSQKPKGSAFKASDNEEKDIEMPYDITSEEFVGIEPWKTWHDVTDWDSFINLFNYVSWFPINISFVLIGYLRIHNPYHLHCTWLRCIRSCTENLSHGFLVE